MKIMHMFSAPFKSGDGSDPFRRYEYCFNEFYSAICNLIDENGESLCDINIHALNCCLLIYINNMDKIFNILIEIKTMLIHGRQELLKKLSHGRIPSVRDIHKIMFKNSVILSHAKKLSVQVI